MSNCSTKKTCNDEFGMEQSCIFLQSIIVDVASFWIHLETAETVRNIT